MDPTDYILSTIEALKTPIKMESRGTIPLEDVIYAKVMSKKFRKLKPGEEAVRITKAAIKLAVKEKKPIRIFQMFGGNKLWRFDEAPEIDWAELFSLTYFIQWARLIASVYEPGVHYEYFSQDISVESLNNVPRTDTDRYSKTFKELLKWVEPYLPANIKISYTRHYDLFKNPDDYYRELAVAEEEVLRKNKGRLPVLTASMKTATELNVKLKPDQEKDPNWREKVELQHQAIFITKTLRKYCDDPHIIWTCPTYFSDSVVTGSTKRSYAKFWAGVGVLKQLNNSYAELVLTPKQLNSSSYLWEDVKLAGLKGKNFRRIRVLN